MADERRVLNKNLERGFDELTTVLQAQMEQNEAAMAQSERLIEATDRRTRSLLRSIKFYRTMVILLFIMVILLFIAVGLLVANSFEARHQRDQLIQVTKRIDSCTTPTGECAQEQARNSAPVIQIINDKLDRILEQTK